MAKLFTNHDKFHAHAMSLSMPGFSSLRLLVVLDVPVGASPKSADPFLYVFVAGAEG